MAMTQPRIYRHESASVPVDFGQVSADDPMTGQVLVKKQHTVFAVSRELIEEYDPKFIYALLRPETWQQRLDRANRDSRPSVRLRRWWMRQRKRLADWIDPERDDE